MAMGKSDSGSRGGGAGGAAQGGADSHAVILATAGYDHAIRFWEALSGICHRAIQYPETVRISLSHV